MIIRENNVRLEASHVEVDVFVFAARGTCDEGEGGTESHVVKA